MVVLKLQPLLGVQLRLQNIDDTPQQDNGSDCGVHVCWAMRHLLVRRLLAVEAEREVDMSLGGKRVDASGMRKDMYKVCEGLRKKASRRLEPPPSSFPPVRRSAGGKELMRGGRVSSGWILYKQTLPEPICLSLIPLTLGI